LGYNKKASVTQAALINGAASHALDFDDSHSVFRGHPSASIIATVFALAEKEKKSGTAMLAAYLVGLDVAVTMGKAAGDSLYERGMHNTSALGVIAAAAAAAHLLDLDFEQTTNALAIATTQAFGLKRSFGTMTKPLHAGQAAEAAVEAALLARMGFTGAQDIFEGPNGFFEVLGGSANNLALAEMGQDWGMSQLSVKYHASCHWTHGGIETIRQIQSRDGVDHATIASIEITVSPVALKTAGVVYPQVGLEGKFSIPYAAMNALVTGKTGIQGFTDEAVNNPDVRRLIEKTTVSTEDFQDWFFTRTVVRTVDGNIYRAELSVFQDLPDLEQKRIGVIKKFNELVRPLLGEEKTTQIRETILALESVKDVSNLNQSEGLQYLYELLITAVEDPMSTYTPEVWGNPASPNTSGDQQ
jgi:2-methylcitrate dehydratase PrpD